MTDARWLQTKPSCPTFVSDLGVSLAVDMLDLLIRQANSSGLVLPFDGRGQDGGIAHQRQGQGQDEGGDDRCALAPNEAIVPNVDGILWFVVRGGHGGSPE